MELELRAELSRAETDAGARLASAVCLAPRIEKMGELELVSPTALSVSESVSLHQPPWLVSYRLPACLFFFFFAGFVSMRFAGCAHSHLLPADDGVARCQSTLHLVSHLSWLQSAALLLLASRR